MFEHATWLHICRNIQIPTNTCAWQSTPCLCGSGTESSPEALEQQRLSMPSLSWRVLPPTCRRDGFTAGNLKDHVLLWLSQSPGSLIYRSRGGITGQQWLWSGHWVKHVPDISHITVLKVNTLGNIQNYGWILILPFTKCLTLGLFLLTFRWGSTFLSVSQYDNTYFPEFLCILQEMMHAKVWKKW